MGLEFIPFQYTRFRKANTSALLLTAFNKNDQYTESTVLKNRPDEGLRMKMLRSELLTASDHVEDFVL